MSFVMRVMECKLKFQSIVYLYTLFMFSQLTKQEIKPKLTTINLVFNYFIGTVFTSKFLANSLKEK